MAHRFPGRRLLAMRGVALIAAAGLSLAALGACSDGGESGKEASGSNASHAVKDPSGNKSSAGGGPSASDATASGSPSASLPSQRFKGKVDVKGVPLLKFLTTMKNWKVDFVEKDGKFLSRSQKGCYLAAEQQYVSGAQGGDQKVTQELANRLLGQLQQSMSDFRSEPSGRTKVHGEGGKDVDGVASMVTYTGKDGNNYRGWYWFRTFTATPPAILVRVNYTCPASAYSESELTKIVEKSDLSIGGDFTGGLGN